MLFIHQPADPEELPPTYRQLKVLQVIDDFNKNSLFRITHNELIEILDHIDHVHYYLYALECKGFIIRSGVQHNPQIVIIKSFKEFEDSYLDEDEDVLFVNNSKLDISGDISLKD